MCPPDEARNAGSFIRPIGSAPPRNRKHGDDPQRDLLFGRHLGERFFRFLSCLGEHKRRAVASSPRCNGDFLTLEVWTGRGLITHYLLFVISLADRVVHVAGITTRPDVSWMLQVGRNLTDAQSGALHAKRYLLIDRDCKYSKQFRRLVQDGGTKVIRLPPLSPNLNAYAERFVRSIKDECLDRMIFVGQGSLRRAVAEYMTHYHAERNHQGLENRLIVPAAMEAKDGAVLRYARLGGTLNFYYRKAA